MLNETELATTQKAPGPNRHRLLSCETLATYKVQNAAQEDLGKLHDVLVDLGAGKIAYGILSFGGFLGLGDKHIAIPWNRLAVDEVNERILVNIERETLENSPDYDRDNPPDMSDPTWGAKVHDHFGVPGYWIGAEPGGTLI